MSSLEAQKDLKLLGAVLKVEDPETGGLFTLTIEQFEPTAIASIRQFIVHRDLPPNVFLGMPFSEVVTSLVTQGRLVAGEDGILFTIKEEEFDEQS